MESNGRTLVSRCVVGQSIAMRSIVVFGVICMFSAAVSNAAYWEWQVSAGEGAWSDGSNWSQGTVPRDESGDYARVFNGGTVVISEGDNAVTYRLHLGWDPGNSGTLRMDGGTLHATNRITVGYKTSSGTFVQNGGNVVCGGPGYVGYGGGTGQHLYELNGGSLVTNYFNITTEGSTFTNNGGSHEVGGHTSINGTYNLNAGTFTMTGEGTNPVYTYVGKAAGATGVLNIGNADTAGEMNTTADGPACLIIGNEDQAKGSVNGWGNVNLDGTLQNNGKVIANGYGQDRTLNMRSFSTVTKKETINADDGELGWYAIDGGRLELPSFNMSANSSRCWGENTNHEIKAVNSVRVFADGVVGGEVSIALLASDRSDVDVSGLDSVIGVWEFSGSDFDFGTGSVSCIFRYDNNLAGELGVMEEDLQVFAWHDGAWMNVTSGIDTENHRIETDGLSDLSNAQLFAVAVPEPASTVLLVCAASVIIKRRREIR